MVIDMRTNLTARAPLLGLWLVLAFVLTAHAQVPERLAYQGLITNPNGEALEDGTYGLTFRLYSQEQGGQVLWSETQQVSVSEGFFSTFIGSVNRLELPFDAPYFLTLQVEGQPESQRQLLSPSP